MISQEFFEWNIQTIEKASKEIDQISKANQMIHADFSDFFSENAAQTNREE